MASRWSCAGVAFAFFCSGWSAGAAIESASESLSRRECGLTHRTQPAPDNPLRDRLDAASSLSDQSLINHFPGFTDSLEAQLVIIDLDQHEVVVPVITHLTEFAL